MIFEINNSFHRQDFYSTIQQSFNMIETLNKKTN